MVVCENSTSIELKVERVSFHRHSDWLLGNSSLELLDRVWSHGGPAGNLDVRALVMEVLTASVRGTDVVVVTVAHQVVSLRVVESAADISAGAIACLTAVDQLLLGQRVKTTFVDLVGTLDGSDSCEGPVCATLVLVFDATDCFLR